MTKKKHEEEELPVEAQVESTETTNDDAATESSEMPIESGADEKYEQLNDTYLRLLADFENYRKRSIREKADLLKSAGEKVLVNILPLVDDFERGLQATETAIDTVAVRQGMTLIYDKFIDFLGQNGVKAIDTADQVFDAEQHEAITTIPAPSEEQKGKIIDCVQKGYVLGDKVIRFPKVVVGE